MGVRIGATAGDDEDDASECDGLRRRSSAWRLTSVWSPAQHRVVVAFARGLSIGGFAVRAEATRGEMTRMEWIEGRRRVMGRR